MPKFIVQVIIENKPYINDPEGETIHRDLIVKALNEIPSTKDLLLLKDAVEGIEGMVDKCQEASDSFTILALSM